MKTNQSFKMLYLFGFALLLFVALAGCSKNNDSEVVSPKAFSEQNTDSEKQNAKPQVMPNGLYQIRSLSGLSLGTSPPQHLLSKVIMYPFRGVHELWYVNKTGPNTYKIISFLKRYSVDGFIGTVWQNGGDVVLDTYLDEKNQQWTIHREGNAYRIRNFMSDKSLEVKKADVGKKGGRVQLWDFIAGANNQLWEFIPR